MSLPNHDELKALFESDPAAFEAKRQALIEAHINAAPEASREALRATQAQVERKLADPA